MADLLDDFNETQDLPKSRHGCVTAWLWLGVIGTILSVLVLIAAATMPSFNEMMVQAGEEPMGTSTMIMTLASGLVGLYAIYLLFGYKKNGFWIYTAASVVSGIVGYFLPGGGGVLSLAGAAIGPLLLWAIFQIQKDGVSAWSHLD